MKLYEETKTAVACGGKQQVMTRVLALEDNEPVPEGAKPAPKGAVAHDWEAKQENA